MEQVAGETCAEVWRTLNLARGGPSFEGFVQGRFVEALRRASSAGEAEPAPAERVRARLSELRLRNPRHHRAIVLLYEDQATPAEAADELGVDLWMLRSLAMRARLALVQSRARQERPAPDRRAGLRPAGKAGGTGRRPGPQPKGRPPAGGRPR